MNRRTELKYLLLIVAISLAAYIETHIFLPALPDMMVWFSASECAIQCLLTWNFVGICLSGPFYGPISDAFGRKKPLLVALSMFLAGSAITLFADNLGQMLCGRVLQGLGCGGCFTLRTAILFDAFQKERAIAAASNLNTVIPLVMAGAPMLGGYLNQSYGFRANFLAIALIVLLSLVACLFFFKETLPNEKRLPLQIKPILQDFKQVFCNFAFWQITTVISLLYAGYIAFLSGTAILFVVDFGMSKKVLPYFQAAILGGWVLASLLLSRGISKWGILKFKKAGITLCVTGVAIVALTSLVTPTDAHLLTCGMVFYSFGANWVIGLYFPEGMEIFPRIKGTTASLLASARLLIAAMVVGLTSLLYNSTVYPLVWTLLATIVIILPTLIVYEKRKSSVLSESAES